MIKPVVLLILDGWGLAPPGPGNAISQAKLTYMPRLWASNPHAYIEASGEAVGLPSKEDGNTETGHINLGAGRIVYQDLPRINLAISSSSFYSNEAFKGAVRFVTQHTSNLHIMGVVTDAGVHAKIEHLYALLELIKREGCTRPVYLHLFTDGRDAPPKSSLRFVKEVEDKCKEYGVGKIATIMGRYYAMDRDRRWERTETAYKALTQTDAPKAVSAEKAIETAYSQGKTDEFIDPYILLDQHGIPYPRITSNDAVIFYNYRIDRPRQLTRAFVLPNFETHARDVAFDPYTVKYYHKHVLEEDSRRQPFKRAVVLQNLFFVTMTEYEKNLPCTVAFPLGMIRMTLGRALSDRGHRQLRISETEKERFVTYYFNGMREDPFPGEDRIIIPSPKVATYDLQPEMSASELTDKFIDRLNIGVYSFILMNLANADMVAHTGNIQSAIKACETVDACVGKISMQVASVGGTCIITADHGNVEEMLGADGEIDTEHSMFPVPCIIINNMYRSCPISLPSGKLSDIAPTILSLMKIPIPSEMTGRNLLQDVNIHGDNL